jgi:hypothetical protein
LSLAVLDFNRLRNCDETSGALAVLVVFIEATTYVTENDVANAESSIPEARLLWRTVLLSVYTSEREVLNVSSPQSSPIHQGWKHCKSTAKQHHIRVNATFGFTHILPSPLYN